MASKTPALLTKAAKDGSLGDCPFTHYARMCLHFAGIDYELRPTKREDKPVWHVKDKPHGHGGSMPCWCPEWPDGTGAISESSAIADMAMPRGEADKAALAAAMEAKLFPSIAKFIKNTHDGEDVALKEGLDSALAALEAHLRVSGAPYFSGEAPGHADAWVATKLYALDVAGGHFKGFALDDEKLCKFAEYKVRVFALPAFTSTAYSPAEAIAGWGEARGVQ